jgi:putative MFS transporter
VQYCNRIRMFGSSTAAFWVGAIACSVGVALHLPMYLSARAMGYRMVGMHINCTMIIGMIAIAGGLGLSLFGLIPSGASAIRQRAGRLSVRAMDDAPVRSQHVALLLVMALAITIDVMKPTTLAFVAPGVSQEYGFTGPSHLVVTWLPLSGITGTVAGSFVWGAVADRIGRRASILYAGIIFVSTSICGAMPTFGWNVLMCFVMGIGAGGMLPIAFVLVTETIPARHRGWLLVLIGGDIAGAYAATSWLAGALTPEFSWRILWLVGLPTGLLLIALNHWIPESPRYLLAAGRVSEAEQIMRRYGAVVVRLTPSQVIETPQGGVRYIALFHKPTARTTGAITGIAAASGLLTYGFQFWVPSNLQALGLTEVTSDYVLRNSALLGLPLTFAVALLYGLWSSKWTTVCLSILTGVSVVMFALLSRSVVHDHALVSGLLVVPLSGISSLVAVITAYASEVYPTLVRSHGVGWTSGVTKAGGLIVLTLVLSGVATPSIVVTGVLGAVCLFMAILVFIRSVPETRQRRLEDITVGSG